VFLDLLIKGAPRDSQALCRPLDAASFLLKDPFDVLLLEFQKSQTRVEKGCSHLSMTVEVKIV
jgi:hypothetical protein